MPFLAPTSCVILHQPLNFPEPYFLIYKMWFVELAKYLAQRQYLINICWFSMRAIQEKQVFPSNFFFFNFWGEMVLTTSQLKWIWLSVFVREWFQRPVEIPKAVGVQVPYIKWYTISRLLDFITLYYLRGNDKKKTPQSLYRNIFFLIFLLFTTTSNGDWT